MQVLACCDEELIGKELSEGKLNLKVKEGFYKEKQVGIEELKELLKDAVSVNLLGEKAVKLALEQGLAKENNVKRIQGVPHVQIFKI